MIVELLMTIAVGKLLCRLMDWCRFQWRLSSSWKLKFWHSPTEKWGKGKGERRGQQSAVCLSYPLLFPPSSPSPPAIPKNDCRKMDKKKKANKNLRKKQKRRKKQNRRPPLCDAPMSPKTTKRNFPLCCRSPPPSPLSLPVASSSSSSSQPSSISSSSSQSSSLP